MGIFGENLFLLFAGTCAGIASVVAFFLIRNRTKKGDGKLGLDELVTLDSGGWLLLTVVAGFGAVVMIGSSAAIGIDYWTGLAINADRTSGKISAGADWYNYLTVGVVGFFFLALVFEFFSDLGTPMASGLKQRNKRTIPELVFAATLGCIVMSLVTKWGYYDDKRTVRVIETAQISVDDASWHTKRDEAQRLIDELQATPSTGFADAKETNAKDRIEDLEAELADARSARDEIPVSHSTNRIRAGERIAEISDDLEAARNELVAVAAIRGDRERLDAAIDARDAATAKIKEQAGKVDEEGHGRTPAGDLLGVRVLRVGLHQFLCWLFPLVFFEARTAYHDTKKKEEANKRRAQTRRANANTWDADYTEIDPDEDREPLRIPADGYFDERADNDRQEREDLERKIKDPGYDDGRDDEQDGEDETQQPETDDNVDDKTSASG